MEAVMDYEIELVKQIGEKIGYGNMMDIASALWKMQLVESGLSEEAASNAAFVPACLPFIKKKWRKASAVERDDMIYRLTTCKIG